MSTTEELPSVRQTEIYDLYQDESEPVEDVRIGTFTPMYTSDPENIQFKRIARVEKKITDVENFENFINNTEQRLLIEHPHIVRMIDYAYFPVDENFSAFETHGFFELCDSDIGEEISERYQTQTPFSDLQIYNIIKNVISGLAFLQRHEMIHGDIR